MKTNVLFDANNLAVRILCTLPVYTKQYKSDHQINLYVHAFLNSFINTLKIIDKSFEYNNIILCWDSKNRLRKKIYSEYKANRKPKTEMDHQDRETHFSLLDQLKESLKLLGSWTCVEQTGYEADDLLVYLVKEKSDEQFIIVSSDNDLYQVLGKRTIMYLPQRKIFYNYLDFQKEFGIIPSKYPFVKAIAGDNSDNIKGIPHVGIKKAAKMIQEDRCWTYWLNKYRDVDLETNLKLITLPYDSQNISVDLSIESDFNKKALISLFQKHSLSQLNFAEFKTYIR